MGAPNWDLRNRGVTVLASGVVVAMTALNVGLAPATADPGGGHGSPTTTVAVPEPEVAAPEKSAKSEKPEKQDQPSAVEAAPVAPTSPAAPAVPSTATAPVVEEAPQTQAPETQAPKPAPETQAPKPATTTATSAAPPESREAAPATTTKPSATPEPETAAATPSPADIPATSVTESAPASAPADKPTDSATESATAATTPITTPTSAATESTATKSNAAESNAADDTSSQETATSSVSQAAREIEPVAPVTVEAPAEDVEIAKTAKVIEQPEPVAAKVADVAAIARIIDIPAVDNGRRANDPLRINDQVRLAGVWDRNVRQWSPDWVQYDDYYRPVFANPYRDPVRLVYMYQNAPRILQIPPLSRIVLEVAQYAAYSFTALVMNGVNTAVNVAVGSFFGGGFFPGVGLPLPPPPPPLLRYDNVPVYVNYSQQQYEPFRVQRIIDVGNDAQYGERKVLLDGVTPAWGEWTQTSAGERQFEVHRTQQFPGLDEPREAPLPGDYNLRLASDEAGSRGFSRRDAYLAAAAILCAVLSAGAVMLSVHIGRRRNT